MRAAATLERRVQVEPRLVRHELGVEPVALERLRERAGQRVQELVVTARRVLVDPVLQVCEEERKVRVCGRGDTPGFLEDGRRHHAGTSLTVAPERV